MVNLIDFLNSQFVSSLFGALVGGGVAIYTAKLQNKQQIEQLTQEYKLQQKYFSKQEKNERERIFLQYTIERAEETYRVIGKIRELEVFYIDSVSDLVLLLPSEGEISNLEFKKIYSLFLMNYLYPKCRQFISYRDELIVSVIIQDNLKLSEYKEKIIREYEFFLKSFDEVKDIKTFEEYQQVAEKYQDNTRISQLCDDYRVEITKYITETTYRLVSIEELEKKIAEQLNNSHGKS